MLDRNPIEHYKVLTQAGDPYGGLASGVVTADTLSGMTARGHANATAAANGITLTGQDWINISLDLMDHDYIARSTAVSAGGSALGLGFQQIEDYHIEVCKNHGLSKV